MPELHDAHPVLQPHSRLARDFVAKTGGGPVASRMIVDVDYYSPHASHVLMSAPVLFWLFVTHLAEDIAEIIEKFGGAKRVLKEEFNLPKSAMKLIAPWPREMVQHVRAFYAEFDPATLANSIPDDRMDQVHMLRVFGRFGSSIGAQAVAPEHWSPMHRFVLDNWRAIHETEDLIHTTDFIWQRPDQLPKRINARNLQRMVAAWDLETREARISGSGQRYHSLRRYPDAFIWEDHCFTLMDSQLTLSREGHEMSHCVAGYHGRVASGRSVIWHVEGPSGDRSTLQLNPDKGFYKVAQNLGPFNRQPGDELKAACVSFAELLFQVVPTRF